MSDIANTAVETEELRAKLKDAEQEINKLKIRLRAEQLRVTISSEYTNFGLWEYDIAEDICYQYKKLCGRYENVLDPIVHFRDTILSWGSVYAEDIPVFNRFCDAMERGDREVGCDVRSVNDNCDLVWFRYEGKTVYDDSGKPIKVVGRTLDVTEEKGGIGEETDTRRDKLTGLYNIQSFMELLNEKRSGQNQYKNAALLDIRIDGFDDIVKTSGSEYADTLQKAIGKIIANLSACKQDSMAARCGDGEFLFFVRYSSLTALDSIAARLVFLVSDYPFGGGRETISMGISVLKSGKKYETAYSEAAAALRAAEQKGGNGYLHYSGSMLLYNVGEASRENRSVETYALCGSGQVYELVFRALSENSSIDDRVSLIAAAIRSAAQHIGVSSVILYSLEDNGFCRHVTYNNTGREDSDCPDTEQLCTDDELAAGFGTDDKIWLDELISNGTAGGLRLINGAKCAECRCVSIDGKVVLYFVFAAESRITLQTADERILTLLKHAFQELYLIKFREEDTRYRNVFENIIKNDHRLEGYSIVPGTYEIDHVGENAAAHYGIKRGEICYKAIWGLNEPCCECPVKDLTDGKPLASAAFYDENERRWLNITASVNNDISTDTRYVISMTDINDCLGRIQNADTLTGVMTIDAFAAEAMRITAGGSDGYFVLVINIAGFRSINEDKGYEFGNSVLIAVADILQRSAGAGELICRSEGSRFVTLYKNHSSDDLLTRLNQLLASIQKQVYERCETQIYLVVGVCSMSEEPLGIMASLDRAITAQKTVKNMTYTHENLIAEYDSRLRSDLRERRYIEEHMTSALDNNEFKVYYQPKVSIDTGRIVGAEALVRWIRPDGEIISPGRFVPIFEENGFIADMDFAIYRQAIADIKRWTRSGIEVPLISLNVSRHHLKDDSFSGKLNALVDSLGVPHEKIDLEITESLLTENINKLVEVMTQLKSTGFRISVDDFGSGYSSLNLITLLPFDTLKIDGGFFLRNKLSDKNKKVISSVVTLAKSLNLETVSEGVETVEQVEFLRGLGCDMIQGYYYFKPMPSADFEKLISAQDQ